MSVQVGEMFASISVDLTEFNKRLSEAQNKFRNVNDGMKNVGKSLTTWVSAPIAAAGGYGIKLAADMEQANVAFSVMLGSQEKADKMMSNLQKFAAETPFEFPEIRQSAQSLIAFGVEEDKVLDKMSMLGDIASGVSMPVEDLAQIYGKAKVGQTIFGDDINQLTSRGIPIIQALAKELGVADKEVKQMAADGEIGFEVMDKALSKLAKDKYPNMMDKQSQTLAGLFSTLKDTIGQTLVDTFTPWIPAIKGVATSLIGLLSVFKNMPAPMKQMVLMGALIAAVVGPLLIIFGMFGNALLGVSNGIMVVGKAFGAFPSMAKMVIKGFKLIGTAAKFLFANPIILAVLAVVAIGYLVWKNWDKISKQLAETWTWIKEKASKIWGGIKNFFSKWGLDILGVLLGPIGILAVQIYKHWDDIKATTARIWNAIKTWLTNFIRGFKTAITYNFAGVQQAVADVWNAVKTKTIEIWNNIKDTIVDAINAIVRTIKGLFDKLDQLALKAKGAKDGVEWSFGRGSSAHWATGTKFHPGGMAWVGERGPELINLPRGAQVLNNRDSLAMANQSLTIGGTVRVEGVNNMNQLVGVAEIIAKQIEQGDRRLAGRVRVMPSMA